MFKFFIVMLFFALVAGCGGSNNKISDSGGVLLKFDETTGTTANNSNNSSFNAVIYGASRVPGKVNNALHLGNLGSRAEINVLYGTIQFPNSYLTIDAWLKPDTVASNGISQIVGDGHYGMKSFRFQIDQGKLQMVTYDNINWQTLITGTQALLPNVWQHVAITYDGTTARTYINGAEDNSANMTTQISAVYNNLIIGSLDDDINATIPFRNQFYGTIDELSITNTVLSAAEIHAKYLAAAN